MKHKQLEFNYQRPPAHRYVILDMECETDDSLEAALHGQKPPTWGSAIAGQATVPEPTENPYGVAYGSGNPYAKTGSEGAETGSQRPSAHRYEVLAEQCGKVDPLEASLHVHSEPIWKAHPNRPAVAASIAQQIVGDNAYGSGNPYANILPEDVDSTSKAAVSKRDFSKRATRIFRQYSPSTGKSRPLRPEFARFIERSASKSPKKRFDILSRLAKYDLEASGFQGTVFNRELSENLVRSLDKLSEDE